MAVKITHPDFRCVPTGGVHARHYPAGTIVDDPFVAAVALRNSWGTEVMSAAEDLASTDLPPAPEPDQAPAADPKPMRARKAIAAAPENK